MMEKCMNSCSKWCGFMCNKGLGLFLIRIGFGLIFLIAGYSKLTNMENVIGFFGSVGVPPFLAWMVALGEFFGGLAFILGVGMVPFGIILAIIMIGAIKIAHWDFSGGFVEGYQKLQYPFFLLLSAIGLAMTGPGKYPVTKKCPMTCHGKCNMMGDMKNGGSSCPINDVPQNPNMNM